MSANVVGYCNAALPWGWWCAVHACGANAYMRRRGESTQQHSSPTLAQEVHEKLCMAPLIITLVTEVGCKARQGHRIPGKVARHGVVQVAIRVLHVDLIVDRFFGLVSQQHSCQRISILCDCLADGCHVIWYLHGQSRSTCLPDDLNAASIIQQNLNSNWSVLSHAACVRVTQRVFCAKFKLVLLITLIMLT
jgi:hypothetical protein